MGDWPAHTIVRDKVFPFTRQEIIKTIPILDVPQEEPSFCDWVNDIPSGSQPFRELCANLSDYTFTTTIMRSELLRREPGLVFLFIKFSIAPSTTAELYSRDVVLMNMILWKQLFDVASIIYTSIIQYIG